MKQSDIPWVVNRHKEDEDVYIGRGSIWGNPFRIGRGIRRLEAIELYRDWILQRKQLLARLPELAGKRLGCFCKPSECHGDVLVELFKERVYKPE